MNFFLNAACSVLTPFYPPIAIKRGLDAKIIGLVFGAHPVGSTIFSMIFGKYMMQIGRKNLMTYGLIF